MAPEKTIEPSPQISLCSDNDGLAFTLEAAWVSKYLWRGFDRLDDKSAFQPSINIDFGTGLSINVWSSFAGASKNGGSVSTVDAEEWNYALTYANSVNIDHPLRTDYALSWIYYEFPDAASNIADAQEVNLDLLFPNICPFGTVPHYQVIYIWAAQGGGASNDLGGFIHVFGTSYGFEVAELKKPLSFSCDLTYNDNAGLAAGTVDHDFSHMTFGLSTSFDCPAGGAITPAVYFQKSFDDSVNTEDELWAGISYAINS